MTNIFFLSLDSIEAIKHCKISGKFDNDGKGKVRLAIRFLVKIAKAYSGNPDLYVFIRNDEEILNLCELDCEYNKEFDSPRFRSSAGIGSRFQNRRDRGDYVQFTIGTAFENPEVVGEEVIFPKNIECTVMKDDEIPDELGNHIKEEDILIKINYDRDRDSSEVLYIFQFVVILENFLPREEIEGWKVPSRVWSANFNIHESIGYESLVQGISTYLRYPDIVELWVFLPSGHQLTASSPLYRKAIKLEFSDIKHRTSKGHEFLTREGDLAVQLMNEPGVHEKFSIICTSPHMIEKKMENLVKGYFDKEKKNFVTWGEFIQPLALLVALFSLVIGVIVVLAVRSMPSSQGCDTITNTSPPISISAEISVNIETIVVAAIFFGISVWAVSTTLKNLGERLSPMSAAAPLFMMLLGIAGWKSIGYQGTGYVRDLTPWFSIASFLIGIYGILHLIYVWLKKK